MVILSFIYDGCCAMKMRLLLSIRLLSYVMMMSAAAKSIDSELCPFGLSGSTIYYYYLLLHSSLLYLQRSICFIKGTKF